jgi:N-formylglutamate deformylase
MPLLPFRVLEPPGEESPLLVEVPHAGLVVDDGTRASCVAPPRSIEKDADRYVDELYADAPRLGATLLVATFSRYVVDLNRAETDVDGGSVRGIVGPMRASRGVVWRLTGDGLPVLAAPLEPAELERRLATVYRPYHEALYRIVRRKVAKHGFAVVLAAHSMPSMGTLPSGRKGPPRADVVPGTRGRTSAANVLIDAVDHHARTEGYSVSHDDPYRGWLHDGPLRPTAGRRPRGANRARASPLHGRDDARTARRVRANARARRGSDERAHPRRAEPRHDLTAGGAHADRLVRARGWALSYAART